METKIIKGQAWIVGDKLVQDQTMFTTTGAVSSNIVPLINNIWDDLMSANGTFKCNSKKNFFYWEYKMTDSTDDTLEVDVIIECPRPKPGIFTEPYDPENGTSDWAKYWLGRLKTTYDNAKRAYTIQPQEVIFPGTEYVAPTGEIVTVEENTVVRDDLGDITNLLISF